MQKFYFAMLGEVGRHYNLNPSDLHDMMKCGYNKNKSTTKLSYEEYYEYLDNVHYFVAEWFGLYFDPDYYKYDNVSYVVLPHCLMDNVLSKI